MSQLAPDQHDVVERGRGVVAGVLDDLRPRLRAASGRVARQHKPDGTPVSDADHEADERLGAAIGAAFPDHGVLSEERDTGVPDVEWCWIVDPIDGTSNFLAGLPWWCVSVALAHHGEVVLGIVDAPALDARWTAVHGLGARRDGEVVRARGPLDPRDPDLRHVPLMLTPGTAPRARKAGLRLNPRVMGAYTLDMVSVAEGVAAGSLAMVPHVWDVAASTLLVTEAGGAAVTLRRDPLLPLVRGQDYRDRTAVVAAGPDPGWVRDVLGPLPPG